MNEKNQNSTEKGTTAGQREKNGDFKACTREEALKMLCKPSYENFSLHDQDTGKKQGND